MKANTSSTIPWSRHLEGTPQTISLVTLPNYAFQFFFRNLGSFKSAFIALTLVTVVAGLFGFFSVYLIGQIITSLANSPSTEILLWLLVGVVVLTISKEILEFFIRKYGEAFATIYGDHLTLRFAKTIIDSHTSKLANVAPQRLDQLTSRYVSYVRGFAEEWFWGTARKVVQLGTTIVILYLQSPAVLAANIIYLTLFLFLSFKISARFAPLAAKYAKQTIESGTITGSLMYSLNSIQRLGLKDFFELTYKQATLKSWKAFGEVRTFHAWRWLIQLGLYNFGYVATLAFGVWQVRNGTLSLGFLVLIKYAFDNLFGCMAFAIEYYVSLIRQKETSKIVREQFNAIIDHSAPRIATISAQWRTLKFENNEITFLPENKENKITIHIPKLEISRGEKIGILGPSGAGKSTILLRIMNLVPATGSYQIDQLTINNQRLPNSFVSLITNTDPLFAISLRDNICLGRSIPEQKLNEILRIACVDQFADDLEARVGEPNFNLSAGQQQRVRLARGLAQDSDIILLDEPFNGIDRQTTQRIITALKTFYADRTIVMVTHEKTELTLIERTFNIEAGELLPVQN